MVGLGFPFFFFSFLPLPVQWSGLLPLAWWRQHSPEQQLWHLCLGSSMRQEWHNSVQMKSQAVSKLRAQRQKGAALRWGVLRQPRRVIKAGLGEAGRWLQAFGGGGEVVPAGQRPGIIQVGKETSWEPGCSSLCGLWAEAELSDVVPTFSNGAKGDGRLASFRGKWVAAGSAVVVLGEGAHYSRRRI